MVNVETIPAVYCKIENRPGTLEHATRILRDARVNIDSLGVETVGGTGFVRILTRNAREATEQLRRNGIEAYESSLVVAQIPNRVGELTRVTSELAAAHINIESLLTTADGRLGFRTSDNDTTARVLGKL